LRCRPWLRSNQQRELWHIIAQSLLRRGIFDAVAQAIHSHRISKFIERLFVRIPYAMGDFYTEPNWDISLDGKYFVMICAEQGGAPGASNVDANRLKVITNHFAELRHKVPRQ
jgi:hypothetical protein